MAVRIRRALRLAAAGRPGETGGVALTSRSRLRLLAAVAAGALLALGGAALVVALGGDGTGDGVALRAGTVLDPRPAPRGSLVLRER